MSDSELTLPYSSKDWSDILTEILPQIVTATGGQWTDFTQGDPGYAVVQAAAAMYDLNAFFMDNQVAEGFLSLCLLRESGVRLSKMLNYNIKQATPAAVTITLNFPAFGSELIIPANSTWSIQGIPFTCLDQIIIPASATSQNITLTQGTPYSITVTAPGTPWYTIVVPTNAANIVVTINNVVWTSTDSWLTVTTPTTYKTYEDTTGRTLMFGSNLNTTMPASGTQINVTALLTLGASGNIESSGLNVIPTSIIRNSGNTDVTNSFSGATVTAALGGVDIESLASIQANAPAFYGTQGRAVTAFDYEAIAQQVPGVQSVKVYGGELVNNYSYVYVIVYGTSIYSVSSDLITAVENALAPVTMVGITPIVQGPSVVQVSLNVTEYLQQSGFATAGVIHNQVLTAIQGYFGGLGIGDSMYVSDLYAAIQGVPGVTYSNIQSVLTVFGTSSAGLLTLSMPSNADVSNCTLVDANNNILFHGNGAQYLAGNNFIFTKSGLADQVCTLTFASPESAPDVIVTPYQVVDLINLNLNDSFVS